MDEALTAELLANERLLLRLGPACPQDCVERLLAAEFVEFGASGRVWTRAAMLEELQLCGERALELSDADCQSLGPDAVLLTYRIAGERESLRSSVWVRREGRWQLIFHQGTLVPQA
jgi:hypothetical protein